ncbi:MAG: hypothetical protein LBE37_02975 [Sphingobacterium sp.]|jgi:hypothetical protein|nr:hypothetical protein [Sphingobacterium sp.]
MKRIALLLFFVYNLAYSQESKIFERLQALENNGRIWYNIDGYTVINEVLNYDFDEKGIKKVLKKQSIKDGSREKDEKIKLNNFHFLKTEKLAEGLFQKNSVYVIENENKKITLVSFAKNGEIDRETERELTNLILEDKIPEESFASSQAETINFGGRKIELSNSCYWTFINTVQCPYLGEMNWSIHKDQQDAKNSIENQLALTKSRKGAKVISEEFIDIEFENISTKAKKVIAKPTGIGSALVGMSGGKELIIYYVAEKVRGNYISCVLSHWNNDQINPETKLPPLLEKVMKLK